MQLREQQKQAATAEAANAQQLAELAAQQKAVEEKQQKLNELQASLWAKVSIPWLSSRRQIPDGVGCCCPAAYSCPNLLKQIRSCDLVLRKNAGTIGVHCKHSRS